jgi:hypothetical protein
LLLVLAYLRVFEPPYNLAIGEDQESVLKTRDIPTLTNPSPPGYQQRLESPPLRHSSSPIKRKKCVQKEFDRADIVRDVR